MIKVSQAEKMQHKRAMEKWWFGNSETNTSGRNEKAKTTVKKRIHDRKQRKCFQTQYAQLLVQKWTLVLKQGSRKLLAFFLSWFAFPVSFHVFWYAILTKGVLPLFGFLISFTCFTNWFSLFVYFYVHWFFTFLKLVFSIFSVVVFFVTFFILQISSRSLEKKWKKHKRRQNGDLVSQRRDFTSKRFEPWYF